jgi:hypothetical protein
MSSQIFKSIIPTELLIKLLESIAIKTDKCYVLNNDCYKKGMFTGVIEEFIKECIPYYHLSKRKYLERKLTYNSFITIIRQICNSKKITYISQIKYDKSNYSIMYYIYLTKVE